MQLQLAQSPLGGRFFGTILKRGGIGGRGMVFVFVFVFFLVGSCLLITLIKCLKGHKSLGFLIEGVL